MEPKNWVEWGQTQLTEDERNSTVSKLPADFWSRSPQHVALLRGWLTVERRQATRTLMRQGHTRRSAEDEIDTLIARLDEMEDDIAAALKR